MERYTNSREDIIVEITENKMCAMMTIKRESGVIEQDEILALINEAGITNGFVSSIDQEGEKLLHKPFKIAEVKGINQEITVDLYYKNEELYFPKTPLNEANIFRLVYVQKGSPIGKLTFNEEMLSRKDVLGNYLISLKGRNSVIDKYKGENVSFNLDTMEYLAEINGYLSLDQSGKYSIVNKLTINQDIGRDYGNIYILGNLTIRGDVTNVRHIRILGALTIEGNVVQSNLYAEQGIIIKGIIKNCSSGGITSPGNIECQDIRDSKVFSGSKLIVGGSVINSRLVGEVAIEVADDAEVIASDLNSSRSIKVGNVKNSSEANSNLEISVSPYTKEQLMILTRELVYFNDTDVDNSKVPIIREEIRDLEEILSQKVEEAIELDNTNALSIETTQKIDEGVRIKILKESIIVSDESFQKKKIINFK